MESQTINGFYAVEVSVFDSKTRQVTGKRWFSPDLQIDIRRETERPSTITGKTVRTVEELSDVQVGF
ncbi:MAG TPA: hypothetical protein VKV17_12500 [Bryobacteraceae bacterium]|nr:hypothetical protein [Bryobacteraceae bacterium]